jgi:hypothetical protein
MRLSLRAEVLASLGLLMLCAIALNAAVLMKLWERDLLARRTEALQVIIAAVQGAADSAESPELARLVADITPEWAEVSVFGLDGERIASSGPQPPPGDEVRQAISAGETVSVFAGERTLPFSRWGQRLVLAAPLRVNGRTVGGIRAASPLEDIRLSVWGSPRHIILFALADGLIIALFGSWLLARLVVRPVERLAAAASSYGQGGPLPEPQDLTLHVPQGNEIGSLAASLSQMLQQLEANRLEREDYVQRLERAMKDLRAAQEEVIHQEKLASVGRLAAGVAHEVGNPIASIQGFTELLLSGPVGEEKARDYLARIRSEVGRVDGIVRGLLDFSRPTAVEMAQVDLNALAREALELAAHQKAMRQVEIELTLSETLPEVRADASQVKQVLVNLILNAADAMPDGGRLGISSRQVELAPEEVHRLLGRGRRRNDPPESNFSHLRAKKGEVMASRFAEIAVTDTGTGIPPADLQRVFDPFFTTKPPGSGTGLGLSISFRIARSFGGGIKAESEPGEGSTFRLLLPVSEVPSS